MHYILLHYIPGKKGEYQVPSLPLLLVASYYFSFWFSHWFCMTSANGADNECFTGSLSQLTKLWMDLYNLVDFWSSIDYYRLWSIQIKGKIVIKKS
jgi:hypothetical protein